MASGRWFIPGIFSPPLLWQVTVARRRKGRWSFTLGICSLIIFLGIQRGETVSWRLQRSDLNCVLFCNYDCQQIGGGGPTGKGGWCNGGCRSFYLPRPSPPSCFTCSFTCCISIHIFPTILKDLRQIIGLCAFILFRRRSDPMTKYCAWSKAFGSHREGRRPWFVYRPEIGISSIQLLAVPSTRPPRTLRDLLTLGRVLGSE